MKLGHSHVTHYHWLVAQSVTNYKYHPGIPEAVSLLFGSLRVSTSLR